MAYHSLYVHLDVAEDTCSIQLEHGGEGHLRLPVRTIEDRDLLAEFCHRQLKQWLARKLPPITAEEKADRAAQTLKEAGDPDDG